MAAMRAPGGAAVLLLVLTGCGSAGDAPGDGPGPVAEAFATAWTEAKCKAAMAHVAAPDDNWTAACQATYRFGTKCDETRAGDPAVADCGPGTKIAVRTTEITSEVEEGDTADLSVLVSYTQGTSTRESRTLKLQLREQGGGWKVTKVG